MTHKTKVDDNDTDDDGLLDNVEIQIGTDPNVSNTSLVDFFDLKYATALDDASDHGSLTGIEMVKANPSTYGLHSTIEMNASIANALADANTSATQAIVNAKISAKAEGQALGIDQVKANPGTYGLYSEDDLNASTLNARNHGVSEGKELGRMEGETSVTSNPSVYNLVEKTEHEEALLLSYSDGVASVISDPSLFNLITQAEYEQDFRDFNDSVNVKYLQLSTEKSSAWEDGRRVGAVEGENKVTSELSTVTKSSNKHSRCQCINKTSDCGCKDCCEGGGASHCYQRSFRL